MGMSQSLMMLAVGRRRRRRRSGMTVCRRVGGKKYRSWVLFPAALARRATCQSRHNLFSDLPTVGTPSRSPETPLFITTFTHIYNYTPDDILATHPYKRPTTPPLYILYNPITSMPHRLPLTLPLTLTQTHDAPRPAARRHHQLHMAHLRRRMLSPPRRARGRLGVLGGAHARLG